MNRPPVIEAARKDDLDAVAALLRACALPDTGLSPHLDTVFVARDGDAIVGSAALECYPDGALLRSVAVAEPFRGTGLGARLSRRALDEARARGLGRVYLLTETAEAYFRRHGFRTVAREAVPESVRGSIEFTTLCPDTAAAMVLELPG